MDTKLKGDIGEQFAITRFMKRDWNVLKPIGDRLPYDLVLDVNKKFVKIQVKCGFLKGGNYNFNTTRAKTNRKNYRFEQYKLDDFDFALCYIIENDEFYVFPIEYFVKFKDKISIGPRGLNVTFKENWNQIENFVGLVNNK